MPTLVKPKAKPKGKPTRTANFWGIRYHCPIRRRSRVISTLCKNRSNAMRRLAEFENLLERGEIGLENPFLKQREQERQKHLRLDAEECLTLFETDLKSGRVRKRGSRGKLRSDHGQTTVARVRRILEGSRVKNVLTLTEEKVRSYLDRAQAEKTIRCSQTRKHYERAIKSFTRWLVTSHRLERDPLESLQVTFVDQEQDLVHERGEFSLEQIQAIIRAALSQPTRAGLSGQQRALLYAFVFSTGFRAREAAAVRKCDFSEDCSFVTLSGKFTKNGKSANQPIPPSLQPTLKDYLSKLADDDFFWPNGWKLEEGKYVACGWIKDRRAGDFLKADAATVGIVTGRAGKESNGGFVLDFHSFRHSYISNLGRSDLSEGMRGELSRAGAEVIKRYTHRDLEDLTAAVRGFPRITVDAR